MRFSDAGFNLEIDLSTGNIEKIATDPKDTEEYLGGLGTNAKIIWDRISGDTDPFSEDNILIFSAGLLCGTPAYGANRTIISSLSPQTKLFAFSMTGGFFAPELKQAGYDKVILRGKSPNWVYIYIYNDKVELREATHLLGKSTYETLEAIREEIRDPRAQGLAIGLAGENKVFFASIETHRGSASRLGLGAVMGDKRVKAIVVRGTKDLSIARPMEFMNECNKVLDYMMYRLNNPIKGVPAILSLIGSPQEMLLHDEEWHTNNFAWGNARVRRKNFWNSEIEKEWSETLERSRKKLISCYNCPIRCAGIVELPGFPTYVMKCYSKITYTMAAMVDSLEFGLKIAARAQHYGVDGFTAPQVMAFATELYENGIITDKDLEGMPKDSREEQFFWLLDRIVRREGIGEYLADGVYWAARRIGRGAEQFDRNTIKKHEQIPIKLGMLNPIYYIMWSTGEKVNITQIEGQFPQAPFPSRELKEEFIKDWIQIPTGKEENFKKFIMEWGEEGKNFPFWPEPLMIAELVEWQELMHYVDDSLGLCAGLSSFPLKPPYHIHNLPLFISYATGIDYDEQRLWDTASRIRNLVRAINIKRGLKREDEKPPEDHWKKRFPEYEQKLLDEYYVYKGWDSRGVPKIDTLERLGLSYVAEEFEKMGVYEK